MFWAVIGGLVVYLLAITVTAVGFALIVGLYKSTRGTPIVPIYLAFHLLVRAGVFFLLGYFVSRWCPESPMLYSALTGVILALIVIGLESVVLTMFTAKTLLPSIYYLTAIPIFEGGMAVIGSWVQSRSRRIPNPT